MIQSKPNSNLLTVADRQFQHHLVVFFLYLYIHKQIQMVLGSPSRITEESSANRTEAKCFPPQRLWQTQLAIGREEGKHGAYTGQEEDRESGLMFYNNRYYDSKVGRFISNDTEVDALEPNGMNRMMYVNGDPISFRDPSGNVCAANVFSAMAIASLGPGLGSVVAAGGGVTGNHTGGGSCSKLPDEKNSLRFLIFFRSETISDPAEKNAFLYMGLMYVEGLSGKGPSPLGKMSRTELQMFLIYEQNQTNANPAIYFSIYALMTTGVLNPKTGVDRASYFHDQFGPKILDPNNRRANSKWMGQAKTASFSHNTWSSTYKREWEATQRSCRDARDLCATVNTIGTVVTNAVTTIVGSTLFSIANGITGL
ncbi:MAG: RHS repeat-associated core domain-containing protein [Leptospiraceae bacterium]|nr:RHS repeat-associated core domain-containing protein [Leptospiraceae bacterium]